MKWLEKLKNAVWLGKNRASSPERKPDIPSARECLATLTPRERQVCRLMLTGRPLRDIATDLEIKFTTVKTHYKHIYKKLKVNNRTDFIARYATEEELPDGSLR